MFRIALAQINATVGDFQGNLHKILSFIRQARQKSADVVVFPELAVCGYPPEDLLLKEHFVNDNIKILNRIRQQTNGLTVIVGFVDKDKKGNLYNAAAVLCEKKIKGIYRKENLPNYGVFDEKRYFRKGEKNPLFSLGGMLFGVNICEDLWSDKGPMQRQKGDGLKFFCNLSSSPYDFGKLKERESLLKKRAKDAKSFIFYTNLVGGQDELIFDGSSLAVNPKGQIIARAKEFTEDLLLVDVPKAELCGAKKKLPAGTCLVRQKYSVKEKPSASQAVRAPLSKEERIYEALVLGTRDYVRKNGFKKVVIGLSGGIDSSLVAAVAVDALGKDNVIGVSMPSRFTSKGTKNDAKKLAENLGIDFKEIAIEGVFKVYLKTLSKEFKGTKPGIAEENIQARIRGNILMALSNKFGSLVLTTGNKSEVAVGYCTLYGDMSGGFAVIKDVPKTMVYSLAQLRNAREGYDLIPQSILKRAPSAELRHNQKDQDSLPEYDLLDSILEDYVGRHLSVKRMARGKNKAVLDRVIKLIDLSEYKRRQSPPGIKITPRAFGKDWRLPITNKYKGF